MAHIYLAMLFHGATPSHVGATLEHVTGREVEHNGMLVMELDGALAVAEISMVGGPLGSSSPAQRGPLRVWPSTTG